MNARSESRAAGKPIRPAQFTVGDPVAVNDQAPQDYRRRVGVVTEVGPGTSECRVEFEDGRQPTTGYLASAWLARVN
jgi:hypothetical protein